MTMEISRRRLLARAGMLSVTGFGSLSLVHRAAAALALTPSQGRGPFYPLSLPLDRDNDLTIVDGQIGSAAGTVTHLGGRLSDRSGRPQSGALVEIWQANAFGRYHHPGDDSPTPIDPNFQGYGQTVTDAEGLYRFRTIRPAPYPGRTPHIHFAIKTRSAESLVTQMYFAGEPGNDRDGLLGAVRDPAERARIIVPLTTAEQESGALQGRFDIVLGG